MPTETIPFSELSRRDKRTMLRYAEQRHDHLRALRDKKIAPDIRDHEYVRDPTLIPNALFTLRANIDELRTALQHPA